MLKKDLLKLFQEVLKEVELLGFVVIRAVTDNYKTNTAMFRLLGNAKLSHEVQHPFDTSRKLFLSFDQNHIKNVRSQFLKREFASIDGPISSKYKKLFKKRKASNLYEI